MVSSFPAFTQRNIDYIIIIGTLPCVTRQRALADWRTNEDQLRTRFPRLLRAYRVDKDDTKGTTASHHVPANSFQGNTSKFGLR